MLKSGVSKFWLRAVDRAKYAVLPSSSIGFRVQSFSNLGCKICAVTQGSPLVIQKAGFNQFSGFGNDDYQPRGNFNSRYGGDNRGGFAGGYDNRSSFAGGYDNRAANRFTGSAGRGRYQNSAAAGLHPIDYGSIALEPINKDFYKECASVTHRPKAEVDRYLAENKVTLHGKDVPRPISNFDESTFPESIKEHLRVFDSPTVIQAVSWPVALSGKDIVSIAKTGSGKTLGFMLPAIVHVMNQPARVRGDGPNILVVMPTRELAQQVERVAKEYCSVMNLAATCCYGGADSHAQAIALRNGVDICVGTPGRLIDFVSKGILNLRRCTFLVLDEADRMLDMGFEPAIRSIVGQIRPDRQTLMFSATWPKEIRELAMDFQKDPVLLNVGSTELAANHNIKQNVEVISEGEKSHRLTQIIGDIVKQEEHKTLIFVKTKRVCDTLTYMMRKNGIPALALHGDKLQNERDWVMNEFRSGKAKILIATDIAARGLDVNDIKFVINYDYANDAEDYVHRIGRTARGNKTGTAYTFFTSEDGMAKGKAQKLINVLKEAKQNIPEELNKFASGSIGFQQNYGSMKQYNQF